MCFLNESSSATPNAQAAKSCHLIQQHNSDFDPFPNSVYPTYSADRPVNQNKSHRNPCLYLSPGHAVTSLFVSPALRMRADGIFTPLSPLTVLFCHSVIGRCPRKWLAQKTSLATLLKWFPSGKMHERVRERLCLALNGPRPRRKLLGEHLQLPRYPRRNPSRLHQGLRVNPLRLDLLR